MTAIGCWLRVSFRFVSHCSCLGAGDSAGSIIIILFVISLSLSLSLSLPPPLSLSLRPRLFFSHDQVQRELSLLISFSLLLLFIFLLDLLLLLTDASLRFNWLHTCTLIFTWSLYTYAVACMCCYEYNLYYEYFLLDYSFRLFKVW